MPLQPDVLDTLFAHYSPTVDMIFNGTLCGTMEHQAIANAGYLHALLAGQLIVVDSSGKTTEMLEPGLILVPRPLSHRLLTVSPEVSLLCATLDLGHGFGNPITLTLPPVVAASFRSQSLYKLAMNQLYVEHERKSLGYQTAANLLLEYLLILLLRDQLEKDKGTQGMLAALSDPYLERALFAMHEAPKHPWTLEELARRSGLSRSSFAARFQKVVGTPPMTYLSDWRFSVARALLLQGEKIKSVAFEVGYADPAAFSRAFLRRFGTSPTQWLQEKNQGVRPAEP